MFLQNRNLNQTLDIDDSFNPVIHLNQWLWLFVGDRCQMTGVRTDVWGQTGLCLVTRNTLTHYSDWHPDILTRIINEKMSRNTIILFKQHAMKWSFSWKQKNKSFLWFIVHIIQQLKLFHQFPKKCSNNLVRATVTCLPPPKLLSWKLVLGLFLLLLIQFHPQNHSLTYNYFYLYLYYFFIVPTGGRKQFSGYYRFILLQYC